MNEFTLQRFEDYRVLVIKERDNYFQVYRDVGFENGGYLPAMNGTQKEIEDILRKENKKPSKGNLDVVSVELFKPICRK